MEQVVTLTSVEVKKTGTSKHGPWALRLFKDAGGNKYQTFDVDLGEKAAGLVGQSVEIRYEVEQNGDYENKVLKAVRPSGEAPASSPASAPTAVVSGATQDERQVRITRQWAVNAAIATVAAGILAADSPVDVIDLAGFYENYAANGQQTTTDEPRF